MDNGDCEHDLDSDSDTDTGTMIDTNTPQCTAAGCPEAWQGDGYCDDACYVAACDYDVLNGVEDCTGDTGGIQADGYYAKYSSCAEGKSTVVVSVNTGPSAVNLRWALIDCSVGQSCDRVAYTTWDATYMTKPEVVMTGGSGGEYTDFSTYYEEKCLASADSFNYKLALYNTGGRGWFTGTVTVQKMDGVVLVATDSSLSASEFFEQLYGPFTATGDADVSCGEGQTMLTIDVYTGPFAYANAWSLETHPGETVLLTSGTMNMQASYVHKICVESSTTSTYKLVLIGDEANGWGDGTIYVSAFERVIASGPTSSAFTREDVGPFFASSAEVSTYPYLLAAGAGTGYGEGSDDGSGETYFDGEWQPFMVKEGAPAYTKPAVNTTDRPKYLYKSSIYPGYWVIATDMYSGNMYGYVFDSSAGIPTDISVQWDTTGVNTAGTCTANLLPAVSGTGMFPEAHKCALIFVNLSAAFPC
eukprot:gene17261-20536_t